ncbi:polymer-forming cytoskeletal protein [Phycisphaerales bacterium AB-hyl4]|uniref:Polymer-forming cytoskeletal protein n=1 Tax=Natronomicrosphaera hydrolytica TaxID=3242702 RepID=A0ABV4UAM6_9BACT
MAESPQTSNGEMTIIGADTHIEGKMRFERSAKINGKFEGEVTAQGELKVSEKALCKANVDAGSIAVDGLVEGNVNCKDRIQLNASGQIKGDIVAAKMIMAEGSSLHGHVAIGPDAQKQSGSATGGGSSSGGGGSAGGGAGGGAGGAASSGPGGGGSGGQSPRK